MEQFSCKTTIFSGPGSIGALKELASQRLLLVTDPFFAKNGTAETILNAAQAQVTQVFSQVAPDPSVSLAAEGTKVVQSFQPDTIVALGGGSAMDCAKAMAYFSGLAVRLVAIPTTSGSGSEVTDFAIVTHEQVKHPLVDRKLQPDYAILDSDLLKTLPKSLIADAGFDILAHALEAYVAKNAGAITDALARDAFSIAFSHLPASYAGILGVRQHIHTAATMAGLAFSQAGLGICHAMAHSLGGLFHVPHGRLNAILLPAVVSCNAQVAQGKYAKLSRGVGLGSSADTIALRNLKNALIRLRKELDLPQTLAQAGVDPQALRTHTPQLIRATLQDPCCQTNPVTVEDFMVRGILEEVAGHG